MSETPTRRSANEEPADEAAEERAAEGQADRGRGSASGPTSGAPSEPASARPQLATTLRAWASGARLPRDMAVVFGLVLPAMLLAANMWRVHPFTIDDSFISFRYARNLARGLGLVYNPGERIEGYTNFLWTVLLAGGIKLGIDPELCSKVMGAGAAFGALGFTYAISGHLQPYRTLPCVATWLLASSIVFSGWSIFGLETGFFVCLVLAGTYLFLRENEVELAVASAPPPSPASPPSPTFPWSGLVFALAGLTRPEAPMFVGLLMLFLGRAFFGKKNLLRGVLFAAPVAAHLAFRHAYYGAWVPNTLGAKTGNFAGQLTAGMAYVQNYVNHAGPVVYLGLLGAAFGLVHKRRDVLALATVALAVLGYVVLVGGDWMKFFRFLAPFEPFCFILVDIGVRRGVDRRDPVTNLALAAFASLTIGWRGGQLRDAQAEFLQKEKHFWDKAAGGTARWLLQNEPGELALGDIGYVGWATDYPILDLLGLVDPVISKLPGGYTQKLGKGFVDRLYEKKSKYVLIISSSNDCQHPSVPGSQVIYNDSRFAQQYRLGGKVPLDGGFAWCIYQRKQGPNIGATP